MKRNENYLQKKKIEVLNASGQKVDPGTIDWNSNVAKSYTYRQPAGAENALGDVKFMFPNPHSIYLHDTPSRELFNRTDRSFSSGCIRVENPLKLAKALLNNPTQWNSERIQETINGRKTTTVNLSRKAEVYLTYLTVLDVNDRVIYRPDIYERDELILKALEK